eukprot:TRINITY_DN6019_c0_g1_i1.p1 TRINITY_DN6019_c0_g1~~TRINITY_DN6019_c0_g1_i1.p1  ORF type:complete len:2125 (-),score=364.81 TRINITY_DN6019_c0_g1_i1:23-6397(-)
MQAIRQLQAKYYTYSIWRRIRQLWNDYRSLADDGQNFRAAQAKLHEFLDSFQQYYEEAVTGGYLDKDSLDKIYGDLGDILIDIIDKVERESKKENEDIKVMQQFINKALGVAELILHDEKYIVIVKETPNLLNRILSLLDSLKTVENKKLLLRVIANLSKDFENKLEIGRLEGFRKILLLLFEKDKELTTEIVKTLKKFLDEISISEEVEKEDVKRVIEIVSERKSSLTGFAGTKITGVIKEVSKVLAKFTSRVQEMNSEDSESSKEENFGFIPSKQEISFAYHDIENRTSSGEIEDDHTSLIPHEDEQSNSEREILKEFMRVQGALSTLTESIQEAAITVQLDLLETISKLLFKSQKNQAEFRKINGYQFLIKIFDTIPDLSSEEGHKFLEQSFNLLYPICIDGNSNKRVGNQDALVLLFRVVSESSHAQVRLHAIRCIQDIISANPLNVSNILYVKGVETLLSLLIAEGSGACKPIKSSELVHGEVLELLQYIGVISSRFNSEVLNVHLHLINLIRSNIDNMFLSWQILNSLLSLTSDYVYRMEHQTDFADQNIDKVVECLYEMLPFFVSQINTEEPTNTHIFEIEDVGTNKDKNDSNNEEENVSVSYADLVFPALQTIGLLVRRFPSICSTLFSMSGSLSPFIDLVRVSSISKNPVPTELVDLSLFVINEIIIADSRYTKKPSIHLAWMIDQLNFANQNYSEITKQHILYSMSHLIDKLRRDTLVINIESHLHTLVLQLVHLLETEHNPLLLDTIWYTFGQIIYESDSCKSFIGRDIGFEKFAQSVIDANVVRDREKFDIILEIMCYGIVPIYSEPSIRSPRMHQMIRRILVPQPRFTKLLSFAANRDKSYDNSTFVTLDSFSTVDEELLGSAPFISVSRNRSTDSLYNTLLKQGVSSPSSKSASNSSLTPVTSTNTPPQTNSDVSSKTSFSISSQSTSSSAASSPTVPSIIPLLTQSLSDLVNNERLTYSSSYVSLAKVQIRSPDVTPLINIIFTLPMDLQKEIIMLVNSLCLSNDANKKVLSNGNALISLLEKLKGDSSIPNELHNLYFELITLLAQYDLTPGETNLLISLASDSTASSSFRESILSVLLSVAERRVPPSFFSFSGISGYFRLGMIENFPPSKLGYTLSCWLKMSTPLTPEQGLLSWNTFHNNEPILELYFKTFNNPNVTQDEGQACLLCIQTQASPSPPENFSFDRYNFSELKEWYHIVLTHTKQQVNMFVNGSFIQSHTTLNYPRTVSKDKPLTGYIGKRSDAKNSFFSGQIGTIHFMNGIWDLDTIRSVYQKGSLWNPKVYPPSDVGGFISGESIKEFLTIHPRAYLINESKREESLLVQQSRSSPSKNPEKDSTPPSTPNGENSLPSTTEESSYPLMGSIQDAVFPPGVVAHDTNVFHDYVKGPEDLQNLLNLLQYHPSKQVEVLTTIVDLLIKNPQNLAMFESNEGYSTLYRTLQKQMTYLTSESFDAMVDLLCDENHVKLVLKKHQVTSNLEHSPVKILNYQVLSIFFGLLMDCCEFLVFPKTHELPSSQSLQDVKENLSEVVKSALRSIHALMVNSTVNQIALLTNSTATSQDDAQSETKYFSTILEIAAKMGLSNLNMRSIQRIVQCLLPHLKQIHVELLLNFLVGKNVEDLITDEQIAVMGVSKSILREQQERMKTHILQELFNAMTKNPTIVENVRVYGSGEGGGGGFKALFSLLKSSEESVRVLSLKMIGVLLHKNKNSTKYFNKISGFEMISLSLAPFPVTLVIGKTMIGLGLDEYKCTGLPSDRGLWGSLFADKTSPEGDAECKNRIIHPEAIHALFQLIKFAHDEGLKTAALVEVSERLLTDKENIEIIWEHCRWLHWCLSFLSHDDRRENNEQRESHSQNTLQQLDVIIGKMVVYEIDRKSQRLVDKLKEIENEQFQGHVVELLIDYFDKNPKLQKKTAPTIIANLATIFRHVKGLKVIPRVYVRMLDIITTLTVHNSPEIRVLLNKEQLYALRTDLVIYLLQLAKVDPVATQYLINYFEFQRIAAHEDFRSSFGVHYLYRLFHEVEVNSEYQIKVYNILKKVMGCIEENKIILKDILESDELFRRFFDSKSEPQVFIEWYFSDESAKDRSIIESKLKKVLSPLDAKFKSNFEK